MTGFQTSIAGLPTDASPSNFEKKNVLVPAFDMPKPALCCCFRKCLIFPEILILSRQENPILNSDSVPALDAEGSPLLLL